MRTRSQGAVGQTYTTVAILQSRKLKNDTIARLTNGDRYAVSSTDNGSGLLLSSGNYANKLQGTNNQVGTSYTLAITDYDAEIWMNNAAANTVFIPEDSVLDLPIDFEALVVMEGDGVTSLKANSGVTLNGISEGGGALEKFKVAAIKKRSANTWVATPIEIS